MYIQSLATILLVLPCSQELRLGRPRHPLPELMQARQGASAFQVTNTGLAGLSPITTGTGATLYQGPYRRLDDRYLALPVSEGFQGLVDSNGDGILGDVLHVYDRQTGASIDTGLDCPRPVVCGDTIFAAVGEIDSDRNADGDLNDDVLHRIDASTGSVTNEGFAVHQMRITQNGWLIAGRDEEGADLSGNGTTDDAVFETQLLAGQPLFGPPRKGTTLYQASGPRAALGDKSPFLRLRQAESFALVERPETRAGRDLNGNGTNTDDVLFVARPGRTRLENLGWQGHILGVDGTLGAFLANELDNRTDLNGDGLWNDEVLQAYDESTRTVANTGLVPKSVQTRDGVATAVLEEAVLQQDLNADGDLDDEVAFHWTNSGMTTNLGLAVAEPPAGRGGTLLLAVSEPGEGADLNRDGDTLDQVLHLHHIASGTTVNVGLAVNALVTGERFTVFGLNEGMQGADFNGDGDTLDLVVAYHDGLDGSLVSTGDASPLGGLGFALRESGSRLLYCVDESAEGDQDLNGNGIVGDWILHHFDGDTNTKTNLGLNCLLITTEIHGDLALVSVDENGVKDLNGDGDSDDPVYHVVELP